MIRSNSHNEVEQRRRQQAKQHYDELRALLPNSSKYDKNAVLQNSILLIQQVSQLDAVTTAPFASISW